MIDREELFPYHYPLVAASSNLTKVHDCMSQDELNTAIEQAQFAMNHCFTLVKLLSQLKKFQEQE
jgi:hypothetical protein